MSRDAETAAAEAGAVVLLSGGMDSATTLAIAAAEGYRCHALSFDYGQRHQLELGCARRQAAAASSHRVVALPNEIFSTSLLASREAPLPAAGTSGGVPPTYVPARNTVFLALALALAENLGCRTIFIGATAVDYPGYPDCRPEFMEAFTKLANLATRAAGDGEKFQVKAPLLHLGKEEIIRAGMELGVDYGNTISCYQPDADARACGKCDSCGFRLAGFAALGVRDPATYI